MGEHRECSSEDWAVMGKEEEDENRGSINPTRQLWNQECYHTKLKPPSTSEESTGDLGKATSEATTSSLAEMGTAPEGETMPEADVSVEFSENHSDNRRHEFCEWHENQHQTARKIMAGSPRQEKTDTPKSPPESADKEQKAVCDNVDDKETSSPESVTGEEEKTHPGAQTDREESCPESVAENEKPLDKDLLNSALKTSNSYLSFLTEKHSEEKREAHQKELSWMSLMMRRKSVPMAKDTSFCHHPDNDVTKTTELFPEKKSEMEKGSEEEKLSTKSALEWKLTGTEKSLCDGIEKKPSTTENTQQEVSSPNSMEGKKNMISEDQQDVDESLSNLDNKFLEVLDALPVSEHLKDQVRASARTGKADQQLADLVDFGNSINKIISEAAKSAPPSVCDMLKAGIIDFLDKLFTPKKEHCLTSLCLQQERRSLLEKQYGSSQLRDKQTAIEMVLSLSQQNKLTNSTLTQVYSCLQGHQALDPLSGSGDVKSLLNSQNHSMKKQEESVSLKEEDQKRSDAPDTAVEVRKENIGMSLKSDVPSLRHLSELPMEADAFRSPVEDSFSFPTYTTSSILADTHPISRGGTDLKVILSLIQKFVRKVGVDSKTDWQPARCETAEQKNVEGQLAVHEDVDDKTQLQKELGCLTEEQKTVDMKTQEAEEKHELTAERDGEMEDAEKAQEKAGREEKEPSSSDNTTHEDEEEITEKSDYEDSEKVGKQQRTDLTPAVVADAAEPANQKEDDNADCSSLPASAPEEPTNQETTDIDSSSQSPPATLEPTNEKEVANKVCKSQLSAVRPEHKDGSSKPATNQQQIPKTKAKTKPKKAKDQVLPLNKQQQKRNERSASKKKRKHQSQRKPKMVATRENQQHVTKSLKAMKKPLHTEDTSQKARPSKQDKSNAGKKSPRHIQKRKNPDPKTSLHNQKPPKPMNTHNTQNHHGQRIKYDQTPPQPMKVGDKQRCFQQPPLHQPLHLRRPRDNGGIDRDWLDVRGGIIRVMMAGDSPGGTSQGQGQGSDGSSYSSAGGASSAQGWGGARPKTSRQGSGSGDSGGGGGGGDDRRPPTRKVPDSLPFAVDPSGQNGPPPPNFKRHRKKQHGVASNEQLCHCLGQAGKGMECLQQSSGLGEVNRCMTLCLHDTRSVTSPTEDILACCTCATLHSLLSHFSMAAHSETCSMCLQLFTLIHCHILHCQRSWASGDDDGGGDMPDSARNVCRRMRQARTFANGTETVAVTKVWEKVRKYLSAALGPALLLDVEMESEVAAHTGSGDYASSEMPSLEACTPAEAQPSGDLESVRRLPSKDGSASLFDPPSQKSAPAKQQASADPQSSSADASGGHPAVMPKAKLCRRPSHKVVPQKTIPEEPSSPHPSPTPPASPAQPESSPDPAGAAGDLAQVTLPSVFPRPAETPEEGEDMLELIRQFDRRTKEQQARAAMAASRTFNDDPTATQKTYGQGGTISMPDTRDRLIRGEQTLSVEMQPVGTPGIGEVVYGTSRQLRLVAQNWSHERDRCKASGICQYQHREEGVILDEYKKQLKILRTRYQKHQQWERLVHLGNGVTGKCHLCIDRTSNFKFCCKKVHILQYEDQEMNIWSILRHPNIVRLYGAIRHGEKIYMLAEFIDGGSLAAMIKEQLEVGRRLSHWTSLNYFRQLLKVLTYLQSVGVLHEDIKADNLLLRVSTTEIVLADFGVAQIIHQDHAPRHRYPVGSPAHWCPEKAASEGHGFNSDVWASACVLIHMLSGSPPWINRFPDAAILNYIIWSRPPPLEDVPKDVKDSVRKLLSCCLTKDKALRPPAEQILAHPAFKLLDQASSLFSIAQHATVGFATQAPPSQPVQAVPQPVQAVPQPVQAVPQPVQAQPQPADPSNQQEQASHHPEESVSQQAPQALSQEQASAPSHPREASSSGRSQGAGSQGAGRSQGAGSQSQGTPSSPEVARVTSLSPQTHTVRVVEVPRQCPSSAVGAGPQSLPRSFPASSATPPGSNPLQDPPPPGRPPVQRKSDPGTCGPFPAQEGGNGDPGPGGGPRRKVGQVMLAPSGVERKGAAGVGGRQQQVTSELPAQQRQPLSVERKGAAASARENWLSLQPTPWPELPSPVFSIPSFTPPVPEPRSSESQSFFFPSTQQRTGEVGASTLNVPAPSQTEGSDLPPSSTMKEEEAEQAQLTSYSTALGSEDLGMVCPPTELHATSQEHRPRVTPQHSESQPPPVTRVGLTKSSGSSLRLYTAAQQEQVLEMAPSSEQGAAARSTPNRSVPSDRLNAAAKQNVTVPNNPQAASCNHQGVMQGSGPHPDILNQYPVLPALTPEDIQVSSSRRYNDPCGALSMIPEGLEQESISPSAQGGASGDSGEGTMWSYIQDQFTRLTETEDQLLQSLHQQAFNRPRLELYAPTGPPTEESSVSGEVCRQPPYMLPRFELLQSFRSDSTLRSCRITTSSEESLVASQLVRPVQNSEPSASCPVSKSSHAGRLSYSRDEPDYTVPDLKSPVQRGSGSMPPGSQEKKESIRSPVITGASEEEHFSSGDMFGAGPPTAFEEVYQYRQQQQQQNCPPEMPAYQQTPPGQVSQPASSVSRRLAKKQPCLRLNVSKPASPPPKTSHSQPPNADSQNPPQAWGMPESGSSTGQHSDSAFLLQTGVSPLTASPISSSTPSSNPRHSDARSRSRNESGSSASTPKSSSAFDQQEKEWNTLQVRTPNLEEALLEVPMPASCSELSSQHLSWQSQGEDISDKEQNDALSMLQESISNNPLGGQRLVFENAEGVFLFDMRVLSNNKGWKELATTFRCNVKGAGFHHFTLEKQDGSPVNIWDPYCSTITVVRVIEVTEEQEDMWSICWCDNHVVY